MNIAPPSVPPPASATEKVYDVDLKLPSITPAPPMETRRLVISRQPTGDFGFNLRWAPYTNIATGVTHHAVHAEPGSSGSKSGVIAGDRIVEINGKNVEECSRDVVIASIQQSPDPLNLVVQQLVGVSELHRLANPPVTALYVNNSPEFKVNNNGDVSPLINGHENSGEENYWLIHKGGYSSCKLIQSATTDGRCKVKLEQGGHILEVDENDLEKVNLPSLDRCEDLSSLAYLNESSLLHVLRQRYGSSLVHTVSGPSLLLINPNTSLNIYSHKVMQMVRACNYSELPPHVYSKAQYVYQEMITTCRDQCIVLSGRTGSGKSTSMRHMLNYYGHVYAGSQQLAIDEKYSSALTVLEALGNYSTQSNTNASGFVHHVTIDFDHYGFIASSSFQVSLLEKSRIVNIPKGETTFHIFQYVLYGLDNSQRQELHLLSNEGLIDTVYSPPSTVDPEDAVGNWNKLEHSLRMLSVTPEEIKAIQHVVAAIIHLRVAGVTKGSNNKTYFADPASAQNAANLLGVNAEDLAKSIFSYSPSTLSSQSNLRPSAVEETLSGGADALDEFIVGIYTQLLTLVVYLINRNLSTVTRNCTSITILDTPGFRDSTSQPATFNHLCYNYINERIQLLFYEKIFTENKERYIQENIEVELDDFTDRPEAMVNLLDKPSNQQQLLQGTGSANSRIDLSLIGRDESADLGLFWILDQMSMTPGATEEQFLDKVDLAHGRAVDQCEKLLTLHPHHPSLFSLNHYYGTAQVTYQCAGWLKTCRLYSNTEQASSLLQSSQKSSIAELFNLTSSSLVSSFTSGAGNMSTLHRSNSLRRQYVNQAGLKRKSQSMSVKYQMDSLLDKISKMAVHFVIHLVPNSQDRQRSHIGTAPLTGDMVLDVPYIRLQIRGMQLLPAVRFHRQGYPEHLTFNEFIRRYSLLCGEDASYSVPLVDQKAVVEEVLATAGVDKSQYRIGLSQVFIRPDTLAQLNRLRELRRSLYAIVIQKYIRRYLAQKAIVKLKLKHEAMRCIQKNIRINFKLEDWQWWKLYTKIKPLVNVQQTEETLKAKEAELFQLKSQLEKVENERNAYKKECARFEDEAVRFQSESVQERQVSRQAVELLEQETSSRLSLESQLNDVVVSHEDLQRKIELLEKENEELRQVHESYEESHHDVPDGSFITLSKYEHMVKENELRRRQLLTEHEEEIEEFKHTKHKLERQVQELVLEKNEQGQVIGNLKKKVQKYSNEAQDLKRQYEDSEARNFELEKRQRRFDSELQLKAGDMAGEKSMKAHLQKERDQLLTQKYSLTQQLEYNCYTAAWLMWLVLCAYSDSQSMPPHLISIIKD
ncbi:hypothetical protein EB796_022191 [Bugula neritina]|uniref:Unconventional myosin-XVIIIa n=1 Tax=Bugula neritina TaxID=10212 RepID=A0A7J7J003_BUGNE|nr:hypothetical protein EB796_022191 [Bugula neritina]